MPFHRAYISLIINGVMYTKKELVSEKWVVHTKSDLAEPWLKSFQNFLMEWVNDADFVTVNTSGSTGNPKSIQLSKQRMMESAFMTGKYFNFKSGQTALLCLPCDYIAGKMMVVRAMMWGLDLQLVPPTGNPLNTINQSLAFAAMVPLQVATIFEQSPQKFSLIEKLIIGGGKVNSELATKLQDISTSCFATYGMTETITHVAIKKLNRSDKTAFFEGLPNIEFKKDDRGCLLIHAPKLTETPVQTNDIVDLKNEHNFEWLGRFDNVINTGGIKVFPEKIETKIEKILKKRFFITSLPDDKLENKVILIIEDTPWKVKKINTLRLDLKQVLSKFEQPKLIYFVAVSYTHLTLPTKRIV